jgi:hypothetical protein
VTDCEQSLSKTPVQHAVTRSTPESCHLRRTVKPEMGTVGGTSLRPRPFALPNLKTDRADLTQPYKVTHGLFDMVCGTLKALDTSRTY